MTDTASDQLARLMHDFGAEWQIRHDRETGIWTAVAYPTPTAQHVLAARGPTELEVKLEAAQPGGRLRSDKGLTIAAGLASPSAGPSPAGGTTVNEQADDTLARLRGRDIAELRRHWDEAYYITWDGRFRAVRLDGGGSLEAETAGDVHVHIRDDYTECPVRRPG